MTEPREPAAELERALLGGERRYTRHEVAELAGIDVGRARRLWVAMGFAEAGEHDRLFTDDDLQALRTLDALISTGAVDRDSELSVARTLGQALSRLAEWQSRELRTRIGALTDDPHEGVAIALQVLPSISWLMSYVWRRQLVAASGRALAGPDDERQTKVIGFADIVGYTATTRHLDTQELAELLELFEEDASETVALHHGQVVKKVGDEVLFTADDPADAAAIALALCRADRQERGLPQLRIGLSYGPVLSRHGDVYGSVVNLAARLTALARPGTVLVDNELADALGHHETLSVRQLRPVSVRGYRHLRPWVLRPR